MNTYNYFPENKPNISALHIEWRMRFQLNKFIRRTKVYCQLVIKNIFFRSKKRIYFEKRQKAIIRDCTVKEIKMNLFFVSFFNVAVHSFKCRDRCPLRVTIQLPVTSASYWNYLSTFCTHDSWFDESNSLFYSND